MMLERARAARDATRVMGTLAIELLAWSDDPKALNLARLVAAGQWRNAHLPLMVKPRLMSSRYPGTCDHCRAGYAEGDKIAWIPKVGAVHEGCLDDWIADPAAEEIPSEKTLAQLRAEAGE